jgi:hypothetical protein
VSLFNMKRRQPTGTWSDTQLVQGEEGGMELLVLVGHYDVPDQAEGEEAPGPQLTLPGELAPSASSYAVHTKIVN